MKWLIVYAACQTVPGGERCMAGVSPVLFPDPAMCEAFIPLVEDQIAAQGVFWSDVRCLNMGEAA